MPIKLKFLGAAGNVTGSCSLIDTGESRILIDCGLHQEREHRSRDWDPFPVAPESITAVLLTHAHLDHCGLLPKLVKDGFTGKIHCTGATAEIVKIMLLDSAQLQEEDASFKKRRHEREGRKGPYPEIPLYTRKDARDCFPLLSPVRYGERIEVSEGVEATFHDAGHVLGSAVIEVKLVSNDGKSKGERKIVFSGDVGRWDKPILGDPTAPIEADYVVVESTYGDREHPGPQGIDQTLADIINATEEAGGNLVVPSFALERTQDLLYRMKKLLDENRIPHLLIFLDSPMAIKITDVFQDNPHLLDEDLRQMILEGDSPFDFPGLVTTHSPDESKAINHVNGTVIIIAGSGMCTGGRIKHHLVKNISRPESTIMFVGYQARGTLGREIVDGNEKVRIQGHRREVRANIVQLSGFSAHADRDELLRWLSKLEKAPRRVFVNHGEPESALAFARHISEAKGWTVSTPTYLEEFDLD